MAGKLLHEDLTRLIIGAGMDVYNSLGPGLDEWDYHRAMLQELASRGLLAESHLRGSLMHREQCIDRLELDILVEGKVILELKHLRNDFAPEHYAQLISYLKFWGKDLGLLMNFGGAHFHFKRLPYTPVEWTIVTTERVDRLREELAGPVHLVENACLNILKRHGLGYRANMYEKALICEMAFHGLDVQYARIAPRYRDLELGARESGCLKAGTDMVLKTSAMRDNTSSVDLVRLQSCMRQLGIGRGVLLNFGKRELLLRGVVV